MRVRLQGPLRFGLTPVTVINRPDNGSSARRVGSGRSVDDATESKGKPRLCGRAIDGACLGIADWFRFIVRCAQSGRQHCTGSPDDDVARFVQIRAVFLDDLACNSGFIDAVKGGYAQSRKLEEERRPPT